MNFKYIKSSAKILAFSMLTMAVSCGEEYLEDADVYQNLDTNTFYQSQNDAVLAVNATYTPLQYQGLYRRYRYLLDYMSGDLDITSGGFQLTEYPGFNFNPSSNHLIPAAWEASYVGISRANTVLEKVPPIQFEDPDLKPRLLGEAKFLRALYYFNLVRLYGGVPIYDRVFSGDLNDPLFQPERNTEEEVYAFIEQDLKEAVDMLPNSYGAGEKGRATAGAAQAMLGKVYLYQQKYAESRAALEKVINGTYGNYSLVDFITNFDANNENNNESVFEIQFETGVGAGFSDGDTDRTAESFWIATALNPGRQRAFANGVPSVEVNEFFDQFPEEDGVRRFFTIARPGDTWGSWDPIAEDPVAAGQWRDRTGERPGVPFSGVRKYTEGPFPVGFVQSPRNFRLMRYAEVLLMFAEAENEVNGPTAAAYAAVNEVRERAQVSDLPAGLSKDQFFVKIVEERRLEFTFEFQRFFDLVRWSKRSNVPAIASPEQMPGFVSGKNEVLPIPTGEIISNPNLTQNPGY
ncbi:RagB/SusD family nutrient uptake outer membrane protein [Galbibacter sp. BG1]|uniref:RagB/SusD family nutrient uptake outer membrane protein n=1 Tax=Galbibacter sp. BG1 TaxID=1170699 RepID=UPI0015C19989|nr:RagB/SusD family nutrient uptake outer membrane protein [Galbibacter sp. BG1]QLE02191.1 RagB/SusD family nutrient uptake outer membrane protein [Galbibacter sp. BG1]